MLVFDKNTPLNLPSFQNNGLGYLEDFASTPIITEELNSKGLFTGTYKLEFEYSKDGKNVESLKELNYLKVPLNGNFQIFYIESIKKTLKKINVYAKHIFFITKNGFVEDIRPTNDNAITALTSLISTTQFNNIFTAHSDSDNLSTAYYIRKNLIESIITADNSLLKNWNCDLELDNFNIKLLNNRGTNRGINIEYGKNLNGIEYSVDCSNIVTRIIPQGANELLLPEKYVDSELINNYPFIYVKHIIFDDVEANEEISQEQAYLILRQKANELYENGIDKPTINIKVNWQDLSKTEEYENYSYFENVELGDIVNIRFQDINIEARIIKTIYDYLQQKYIAFELGNVKSDLLKTQQSIAKKEIRQTINVDGILNKAKVESSESIKNAMGGYATKTENEYFVLDTGDINTAQKVGRWNINGLGFSNDGVNGIYDTTITSDGKIVLDKATVGTLDGQYIKGNSVAADKIDTSTFKTGGDNIIKDSTGIYNNGSWDGDVVSYTDTETKQNTDSQNVIYMQNNARKQIRQYQNGILSISFKYKKLITLANPKIKINGYEVLLTSETWKKENYTFEILSNTIEVEFSSDTNNSCWLGDLVCRASSVAGVWSSAPGESNYGGVKISNFIEVDSTTANTKTTMDNEGFRTFNKTTNEAVMQATDKGGKFKHLESESSKTAGILRQKVSATQTWDTWVG